FRSAKDSRYGWMRNGGHVMEKEIGENPFLAGATPTIADFTAFPIFQTARERFDLPFGDDHPRLESWYRRFRSRPSADY
uniref:glutathione S-transferase family protein n=1 Tax=uncultured Brevundimonas sp. TaxID=213418 RepID=UPI0025F33834